MSLGMEKMANVLEQRISSLSAKDRQEDAADPHSQLLTSPSMDSLGGMGSTGAISPIPKEGYLSDVENGWPDEIHQGLENTKELEEMTERKPSGDVQLRRTINSLSGNLPARETAFSEIANQPVDEIVSVGPSRIYHGLTRGGIQRHRAQRSALEKIDPVGKWREHRTLLILWLVTALVTFITSLRWLQVGMWAGLLGFIGPSFSVCHCCSDRKLPLNLQVTRIFAVSTSALSTFAAVLFTFLLIKLPCPAKQPNRPSCSVFRAALAVTAIWHASHALISGLVSARASKILSELEPLLTRKVLIVQNNRSSTV